MALKRRTGSLQLRSHQIPSLTIQTAVTKENPMERRVRYISDGKDWGKKVDPDLREYISTDGCQNKVNDVYFNNPPLSSSTSGKC